MNLDFGRHTLGMVVLRSASWCSAHSSLCSQLSAVGLGTASDCSRPWESETLDTSPALPFPPSLDPGGRRLLAVAVFRAWAIRFTIVLCAPKPSQGTPQYTMHAG
mmetsp:Transcript_5924/g.16587  ORF Transcript_5924/g.16587 Transcript_5924/m.16587 type:complete len:105 (-) Transcript_5924:1633-1947(-)